MEIPELRSQFQKHPYMSWYLNYLNLYLLLSWRLASTFKLCASNRYSFSSCYLGIFLWDRLPHDRRLDIILSKCSYASLYIIYNLVGCFVPGVKCTHLRRNPLGRISFGRHRPRLCRQRTFIHSFVIFDKRSRGKTVVVILLRLVR